MGDAMDAAEREIGEIDPDLLGDPAVAISRALYSLLIAKCEGKAFGIVRLVPRHHGLEAWRRLKLEYEAKTGGRFAAMLRAVLNPRGKWSSDCESGK